MSGRVPLVRQVTETECGLCCCAMILRYFGSWESIQELQEHIDVGRDGLSLLDIKKFLIGKGIESKIYNVKDFENIKKIKSPFICYVDESHFVIVEKTNKEKIYVLDSAQGRKCYKQEEFQSVFSNVILVITSVKDFVPQKKKTYNPWKYIWMMVKERKLLIFEILLLLAFSYAIALLIPTLIQKILDKTIGATNPSYLYTFILIIAVCFVVSFLTTLLEGFRLVALNVFLGIRLEADTYQNIFKLPYKFFETRSTGDLMYRLQSTTAIKEMISANIINGLINIGSCVVILVYMFNKSLIMSGLAIVLFALNAFFIVLLQPKLTQAINGEIMEQSKSQTAQIESLYSIMPIKISGLEENIYSNWLKIYERVIKMFKKRMVISNFYSTLTGVLQTFSPIILLCLGIKEYFSHNISIGEVIAFQSIATTFFSLSVSIINVYPNFVQTSQYLDRLSDIWSRKPDKQQEGEYKAQLKGDIELKNISFSYSKSSPQVLRNISMKIEGGSKVAIVGASGSGKSSLSKILVGLYEPSEGEVLYDNIPINEYDHKSLCNQISIVPQDSMLFNKSIYDNITMGDTEIPVEKVKEYTHLACIDEEIESMPMKYNTVISEMGMNLSGGQRQRILLARALVTNPKILVLDEATSSLDNVNEKCISEYLSEIGCTRIIIAHRLSSIIDSDIIFVLKNGELVECGNHEDLVNQNGEYANLYNKGKSN